MKKSLVLLLGFAPCASVLIGAEPKRILVVTTTTAFRHSTIELGEKVLRELAAKSGEFVIVSTADDPDFPDYGGRGRGGPRLPGGTVAQQAAANALNAGVAAALQAVNQARQDLTQASFVDRMAIMTRVNAVAAAELALANARADAFGRLQRSPDRITRDQALVLAGLAPPPSQYEQVRTVLAKYLSAEGLKNFDGVFFDNNGGESTLRPGQLGELPLPDKAAFFKWVAEGHAVMAVHAASDSMHETPEYETMLGGEFARHGQQTTGHMVNMDPKHPANASWGPAMDVYDELYMFKPNYDRSKVHSLIAMTTQPNDGLGTAGAPGWFPVSWTKMYGKGRIFYTALGHREDVWDPNWKDANGQRQNPPEVAVAFQQHLLGGIRWALGLVDGDTIPQPVAP